MRTTLDLPDDLVEEAMRITGFKSKTDAIILSLRELIRRKKTEELKAMMGQIRLEIDIPRARRRSTAKK